jgi:Flp pilus assembly protein TadD
MAGLPIGQSLATAEIAWAKYPRVCGRDMDMKALSPTKARRFLIAACLVAAFLAAWRVGGAAAELQRTAAVYQLGMERHREGRLDEAADAFRRTIERFPRMLEAHRKLAEVEVLRGRVDEAIGIYRRLIAVYPYSHASDLHRDLGFVELNAGRLEDAHTDLLRAVALDAGDWRAHQLLGQLYQRQGDIQRASAAFQKARDLKYGHRPRL